MTTKPDILRVIKAEGVEMTQRGARFWACCPFHSEKTPSFVADPATQRFCCFGCAASGDVYDFVQKYRSISFVDAKRYLGDGITVRADPVEARRRRLVTEFQQWCSDYSKWCGTMVRLCHHIDTLIRTPEDFEIDGVAEMYSLRDLYAHHLDILTGRDVPAKFKLYKEFKHGRI